MCGIVGIVSGKDVVVDLIKGLSKLEYRGYDSAGIATVNNGIINLSRCKGKVSELKLSLDRKPIFGTIGIAHTRWATHGEPSEINAHPHVSDEVAVVHNGIIENYLPLRNEAEQEGYVFKSQTDTEVITALITLVLRKGYKPLQAVFYVLQKLEGAFAIEVLFRDYPDFIIAARRGAPLAVGYGKDEMFIGSDAVALSAFTDKLTYLEDGDVAVVTRDKAEFYTSDSDSVQREKVECSVKNGETDKKDYPNFMMKEIFMQPKAVKDTLQEFVQNADMVRNIISETKRIFIVACGTSYHAAMVAKYWFEEYAGIPVSVDVASEFRYRRPVLEDGTLAILISQSGETADTLAALRYFKDKKIKTMAIVNVPESTMAREADYTLFTKAGVEIAVASTKAFTTQLVLLASVVIVAAKVKKHISYSEIEEMLSGLQNLPDRIDEFLSSSGYIEGIARDTLSNAMGVLYMGRGTAYPIALEGALKIKEISYIHAEGYAAGEMKHGPIALVDENMPVVILAQNGRYLDKTVSNLQEILARKGNVICIASDEGFARINEQVKWKIAVPDVGEFLAPIIMVLPVQLLAYSTALIKGKDVDQPRNLAKSVTVE